MFTRLRTGWLAGGTALLLMLALTGVALGADGALDGTTDDPVVAEETLDTTATFEDLDGDGVDDDCQDGEVVANEEAAAAALAAADLNGDGVISVFEAAQSDWVGGRNCNHGGYVSFVAHGDGEACEPETTEPEVGDAEDGGDAETGDAELAALVDEEVVEETEDPTEACAEEDETVDETEEEATDEATCEAVPAPELPTEFTTVGAWVSLVAQSDATGGKNCNHGGAVSAAAKAAQAARDLAREARAAEREAARAERDAAKAERAAQREAAKASRGHGKGQAKNNGKGNGKGRGKGG